MCIYFVDFYSGSYHKPVVYLQWSQRQHEFAIRSPHPPSLVVAVVWRMRRVHVANHHSAVAVLSSSWLSPATSQTISPTKGTTSMGSVFALTLASISG